MDDSPYHRAQRAIGAPIQETTQVDASLENLREVVEFHSETVQILLRRLQPVTGEVDQCASKGEATPVKVPMAERIDMQIFFLRNLTEAVQQAIRALQI
jgi:hypothetical protein